MLWTALILILAGNAGDAPKPSEEANPIVITFGVKADKDGRWCAYPTFEATLKNASAKPVWLDLGERSSGLVVTSYSIAYSTKGIETWEGSVTGTTDDWGSIEYLRSPKATSLGPGDSVTRPVKLEDVRLKPGRANVELAVRIHGTQELANPNVRTYEATATNTLVLRRIGRCFEVRRLTSR